MCCPKQCVAIKNTVITFHENLKTTREKTLKWSFRLGRIDAVVHLFEFAEIFVLAQLFEIRDRLGVVETIIMIHLPVSSQLR